MEYLTEPNKPLSSSLAVTYNKTSTSVRPSDRTDNLPLLIQITKLLCCLTVRRKFSSISLYILHVFNGLPAIGYPPKENCNGHFMHGEATVRINILLGLGSVLVRVNVRVRVRVISKLYLATARQLNNSVHL